MQSQYAKITSNELPKKEFKKVIPFIIASKKGKILGINLTKRGQDLNNESY